MQCAVWKDEHEHKAKTQTDQNRGFGFQKQKSLKYNKKIGKPKTADSG